MRIKIRIPPLLIYTTIGIFIYLQSNKGDINRNTSIKTPIMDTVIVDSINIDTTCFMNKSPSEGLMEALIYYNVKHPEIVYAQAILETGHFTSAICQNKNNLFGLYNSNKKEFYSFEHWSESIKAYINLIQYRYIPPNDYYKFLSDIGYAEDPYYINKLKRIVNSNDKGRSLGGGKDYS